MRVLIADDDPLSLTVLRHVLTKSGYDVSTVRDGQAAWQWLSERDEPLLAILDWIMPGLDGLELCTRLRERERVHPLYIIILTTRGGTDDIVRGLTAGADDYVSKPYKTEELRARVDLGARTVQLQSRLTTIAYEDAMTGLHNRLWLTQIGSDEIVRSRRYGRPLGLLLVDVDKFKGINDNWGHAAGDEVLRAIAERLEALVRHNDAICRLGGDEMVILTPETDAATAFTLAERVLAAVRELQPTIAGRCLPVTVSLGVAELEPQDRSLDDLLARADRGLYDAKHAGGDCARAATDDGRSLRTAS